MFQTSTFGFLIDGLVGTPDVCFSLQDNYNHNDYVYSESKFTDLLWDFPFVKFDTKEFSVFTEI